MTPDQAIERLYDQRSAGVPPASSPSNVAEMAMLHNDQNTPENPFFRLQTQGFWEAWIEDEAARRGRLPLQTNPLVNQIGRVFAKFTDGFEFAVRTPRSPTPPQGALVTLLPPSSLFQSTIHNPRSTICRRSRRGT